MIVVIGTDIINAIISNNALVISVNNISEFNISYAGYLKKQ